MFHFFTPLPPIYFLFFSNDTATTDIYTLSLHDALPICRPVISPLDELYHWKRISFSTLHFPRVQELDPEDRKSTRLNSSHVSISYAVFCLKKKKKKKIK